MANFGKIYESSWFGEGVCANTVGWGSSYKSIANCSDASFSYAEASYAQDGTNPTPTITGDAGGTFTATPAGLSINSSTGEITLSTSTINSYTVKYTLPDGTFADQTLGITAATFSNTFSLALDGVDDYVDTGISTLTGTDFSISYWFKTTATLTNFNYYVPFSAVTNQQFVGAYLYYHPTTKLTFRSRNSSGTLVKGTVDLSDGNWHNIVVTYDSTSYALKMYVDGSIDYDETIYSYAVFNQPLLLGGKSSSLNLIDCSIDEASLFNSVLTSANVTSIYNSGEPKDLTSLNPTAWWIETVTTVLTNHHNG